MEGLADQVREALGDRSRAALEAIVVAPEAWSSVPALELAGVTEADVDELVALGLAVRWRPRVGKTVEDLVTLTAWGAYLDRVEIDERMQLGDEQQVIEVPYWVGVGDGSAHVVLPKHARGYRIPFPELIEDPAPGPDVLLDEMTGEPVLLWGRPIPLRSDRRRRGRSRASA